MASAATARTDGGPSASTSRPAAAVAPSTRGGADWRHAVAGGSAGLAAVLATHPLDLIKTRMQVQDGVRAAGARLPLYRSTSHAVMSIWRTEGWRGYYAGLSPALLGSAVSWALYFCAYQAIRSHYSAARGDRAPADLPPHLNLAAAAQAGAAVVVLTNPIWVLKTRLQLQAAVPRGAASAAAAAVRGPGGDYAGLRDALGRILREEGPRGLYRGLAPALVMVSHGAVQFTAYEELKRLAIAFYQPGPRAAGGTPRLEPAPPGGTGAPAPVLGPREHLAMGALSKLMASTVTYPLQTIRSRLQQRMDVAVAAGGPRYAGLVDAVQQTWQREGLRGFYRGVVPNVLRVMPASAVTFAVYEAVLKLVRSAQPPPP